VIGRSWRALGTAHPLTICSHRANIFVENDRGVIKRMELIDYELVEKFAKKHARSRPSLNTWSETAIAARWKNFDDVKKTFRAADLYGDCVIFDIGGNKYRLIAKIEYEDEQISINEVMTHAEYDKDKWKKKC
jgi:mRNA interferase HigB